ncbi:uncharacterized protein LOC143452397 [Clavelina lepadiformis]|uniref:Protein kinase domain-containing protein n=1 Tax=Clavelina lepadiformis TaxID=159417 RepID=A0ABP0GV05_CLALP
MTFSQLRSHNASDFCSGTGDIFRTKSLYTIRRCEHDGLGTVVVKVFKRRIMICDCWDKDENEGFEKMLKEAKQVKSITHKNIIQYYGVIKWYGFAGIVMELADCGNLDRLLRAKSKVPDIPWWLRQRLLFELFQALRYLHNYSDTLSIAHGDVKSANILLTPQLIVKLTDFKAIRMSSTSDKKAPSKDRFRLNAIEVAKHQKFFDIYSASQVACEIITRRFLKPTEFGYLTSLGQPITNLIQLESKHEFGTDANAASIFKILKEVALECARANVREKPDAITVVGMLSKGETNFYSLKKSGEAWSIAKQMSRFRSESDSRESLDVIYTQSPVKPFKFVTARYPREEN